LVSSVADIAIGSVLAVFGIGITPLAPEVVAGMFGAAVVFAVVLDVVKLPIFARLRIN
jgi:H+-transporting ATPase